MKAPEFPERVVVLDTNVYRRLGYKRSAEAAQTKGRGIAAHDRRMGVQALAHPLVMVELLAHLADPQDKEWSDCRSALIALVEHCTHELDGVRRFAVVNDPETELCRVTYGRIPAGYERVTQQLISLSTQIAKPGYELTASETKVLEGYAKTAAEIEQGFVDDIMTHIIHYNVPEATSWDALKRDPQRREEALAVIDSVDFLPHLAIANVIKARGLLGLTGNDPLLHEKAERILDVFTVPLYLYRAVLRKVIKDGVDVSKGKNRNWIWDLNIAYSLGPFSVYGGRGVTMVSDDNMIVDAAEEAGLGDRIISYDAYSASLRSK